MKASIHGRVSHTNLPKGKALLPLFEAIINAHQAIDEAGGSNHSIRIIAERQGDLDDDKPGPIEAFAITDTGIGFTAANFESFNTVDSLYKATLGGKGLGRFLWLRAFHRVEIDSHYREADTERLLHRHFNFIDTDDEIVATPVASARTTPLTTVHLVGYRHPYLDECPRSLDGVAQRLIGHFLPLFLNPNGPALTLNDRFQEIDLREFYRRNFEAFATRRDFTVADQNFSLSGFRLQGAIADHHEVISDLLT
jgi:hypothetical protein